MQIRWRVAHYKNNGAFNGMIGVKPLDKADAELLAQRYENHYGPTYRAVAVDKDGYIISEEKLKQLLANITERNTTS